MKPRTYIGDSVYAEINDAQQLVLTTDNGFGPSNIIYLEPEVLKNLLTFISAESPIQTPLHVPKFGAFQE